MPEAPSGNTTKERTNMIKARRAARLTQKELATIMKVNIASIVNWEKGHTTPQLYQIADLREAINFSGTDEELLQVFSVGPSQTDQEPMMVEDEKSVSSQPCQTEMTRDILDSSDSHMSIQESARGFREFMEMLRRQFIEALAKLGGTTLFGDVSLGLVSSLAIAPDEYLFQASASIDACWQLLHNGNFNTVGRVLNAHMPTLKQLANIVSPHQGIAANLATQANIMQANIAGHRLDYVTRKIHCIGAVYFGTLSGDKRLLATALDWQGNTYIYCYHQPQRAIALFNDALSIIGDDAPLNRASLYIQMAIAHAMDRNKENTKETERLACDYIKLARTNMPNSPMLDEFYSLIGVGTSELDQFEASIYLDLANLLSSQEYAKKANMILEEADNRQTMGDGYRCGLLTKKADAARLLNNLDCFVDYLIQGLHIALAIGSQKRVSEADDVLHRIPENWQRETVIQDLQKDISQALIVARR